MTSVQLPARGRIVGVDFGSKRIGLAVADLEVRIASPFETYHRRSEPLDRDYFLRLAKEERVQCFVIGLPVHNDGRESVSSIAARDFGAWLGAATGVPIAFCDERYTSVEAEQFLNAAKLTKQERKARIDKLAAQILLTAFLESTGSQSPPPPLDA